MMLVEVVAFIWLALAALILLVLDRLAGNDHGSGAGAPEWYRSYRARGLPERSQAESPSRGAAGI